MEKRKYFRRVTKKRPIKSDEHVMTHNEYLEISKKIKPEFISKDDHEKWLRKFTSLFEQGLMVIGYFTPDPYYDSYHFINDKK